MISGMVTGQPMKMRDGLGGGMCMWIPIFGLALICRGHALKGNGAGQSGTAGVGMIGPPVLRGGGTRHLQAPPIHSRTNRRKVSGDRAGILGPPVLLLPGHRPRLGLRPLLPLRGVRTDPQSAGSGGPISLQSEALAPTTFFVAYFHRPW